MTEQLPLPDPNQPHPEYVAQADMPVDNDAEPEAADGEVAEIEDATEQVATRGLAASIREHREARKELRADRRHRRTAFKEAERRSRRHADNRMFFGNNIGVDRVVETDADGATRDNGGYRMKRTGFGALKHPFYATSERTAQRRSRRSRELTDTYRRGFEPTQEKHRLIDPESAEAKALQSPKPFDVEAHIRQVAPTVGMALEKALKAKKVQLGLADDERLPLSYVDALTMQFRKIGMEAYLDDRSDLSVWEKNKIRERYGILNGRRNGNGKKKPSKDARTAPDAEQKSPEELAWEKDVQDAKDLGILDDTSLRPLLIDIGKRNFDTAGAYKQRLTDGINLTPEEEAVKNSDEFINDHQLPKPIWEAMKFDIRVNIAKEHLDTLLIQGDIDDYDDDVVSVLERALDAAFILEQRSKKQQARARTTQVRRGNRRQNGS